MAVAIHTRLFARLREQAGIDAETVQVPERSTVEDVYAALRRAHPALESELSREFPDGATVAEMWQRLAEEFPALKGHRDSVGFAVNQEYVHDDYRPRPGDEVAFIPPVSGGANTVPGVPANSRRRL